MKKIIFATALSFILFSCNNPVKPEQDEQRQRDSMDAAQRVKDSMDVEAKMLMDMEADAAKDTLNTEAKAK